MELFPSLAAAHLVLTEPLEACAVGLKPIAHYAIRANLIQLTWRLSYSVRAPMTGFHGSVTSFGQSFNRFSWWIMGGSGRIVCVVLWLVFMDQWLTSFRQLFNRISCWIMGGSARMVCVVLWLVGEWFFCSVNRLNTLPTGCNWGHGHYPIRKQEVVIQFLALYHNFHRLHPIMYKK